MWEALAIVLIAGALVFWTDSLRARERALAAGREACRRYGVQFLDETVAIARLRVARDAGGRVRLARTYAFEFSDNGNNRRSGAIVMLGGEIADLRLEPYALR